MDLLLPEYPNINSKSFYQDIYRKKEFNDLKKITKCDELYENHQLIVARFISNWTLYQSLIILHDTGTGKSGVAAATFTGLKKNNLDMTTLYITHNDTLLNNFKDEIYKLSPILNDKSLTKESEDYISKRNSILRKAKIYFYTNYTFANKIESLKKTEGISSVKKKYGKLLIILDEVHHLVNQEVELPQGQRKKKEKIQPYDIILNFLHQIDYKKILLMTATPMRNSPCEIAPLLNLILPYDNQLPIGDRFEQEYFNFKENISGIAELEWKKEKIKEFMEKIRGIISVVKQKIEIPIEFKGEIFEPMKYFRLYLNYMNDIQTRGYSNALDADLTNEKESSFYNNSKQASLFVFPDYTYGIQKNNPYITNRKLNSKFINETGFKIMESKRLIDLNEFDNQRINDNLNILKNYSITYYNIINQCIQNRQKQMYVYCDRINGSGILICIQLLTKFFGYEILRKVSSESYVKNKEKPRCIFLNDTEENKADIVKLIDEFNNIDNIDGRYIQIIFGTDKTREGISLKRIEQIHICSSDWNFGKIFQAMGRGIRLHSHAGMPLEDTKVEIFFHCAVPKRECRSIMDRKGFNNDKRFLSSIDFFGYYRSECRDVNIKKIEFLLLIGAMDCQLNKLRNLKTNAKDYSTDCFYEKCDYKCIGFNENPENLSIDDTTYNLYYIDNVFNKIIIKIKQIFHQKTLFHLSEILDKIDDRQITDKQIMDCLAIIIDKPILIPFYDDRKMFLNQYDDIFFLTEDRILLDPSLYHTNQIPWIANYSINPSFRINPSFDSILDNLKNEQISKICKQLKTFFSLNKPDLARTYFQLFSEEAKEIFYKELILYPHIDNSFIHWLRSQVLSDILKYNESNGTWFWKKSDINSYTFDPNTQSWILIDKIPIIAGIDQLREDHTTEEFINKYIRNKYIYGFIEENAFKIRVVSDYQERTNAKTMTKGKDCTSYDIYFLIFFILKVYSQLPTDNDLISLQLNHLISTKNSCASMNLNDLQQKVQRFSWTQSLLDIYQKTISDLSIDELRIIFFYKHLSKQNLCKFLKYILEKLNLISKPPLIKKIEPKVKGKRGRKPKNKALIIETKTP